MPAQQEYSLRQNQLVLLSLLADALVDLLCEDEIEVLRSSAPESLTDLVAPPHPKKDLADCCIPLIRQSQQIINKVHVHFVLKKCGDDVNLLSLSLSFSLLTSFM